MAFAGVFVVVGPQYDTLGFGLVPAFICVVCSTVGVLLARRIGHKDPLPVYSFFPFLVILLVNAPFAQWDLIAAVSPEDIARFLGLGIFITIGHIGVPIAYAKAPQTSLVAPVFYTQILWGILYGAIFFDRLPTWMTLCGATLIISSGLYMLWMERNKRRFAPRDEPIEIE
jgi:drug/metabolite transporter (DMT)-like permease